MLLSLKLLKQFVDVDTEASIIADKITLSLTEVEKIEKKPNDTIIEIENKALTHRPDCFSHLGMAREIGAFFNKEVRDPLKKLNEKTLTPESGLQREFYLKPTEIDRDYCRRYSAIVLTNISVGPSPKWLSETLENTGIRSINNVVDITNYVMIELGQPLHAFDYDTIEGRTIKVRKAKNGETITTLDGKERELTTDMLVIADASKPVGIAGIMGGTETEVSKTTKAIILEAATFEPMNNRKTSKALRLRTEASTRFEKNLDPNLPYPALIRAVELLKEHAGAKIASNTIDVQHTKQSTSSLITVNPDWICSFLGRSFTPSEIQEILLRIGVIAQHKEKNLELTIPSWRGDLTMPADIAEEVARISGYDEIPVTLPAHDGTLPPKNKDMHGRTCIKLLLKGMGFSEVITSPFVGDELLKKTGLAGHDHLELQNPLTVEQKYMRRTLFPSLLTMMEREKERTTNTQLRIYELNKLFVPVKNAVEPLEPYYLSGIVSWDRSDVKKEISDFYRYTKGFVESLFDQLNITDYSFQPYTRDCDMYNPFFHPNMTAQMYIGTRPMGILGALNPEMQTPFGFTNQIFLFDMHAGTLIDHAKDTTVYQPIPIHPPIIEDKTIKIKNGEMVGNVIKKIKSTSSLILSVELVDIFEDNYTFRTTFQHPSRNLTDAEVRKVLQAILT